MRYIIFLLAATSLLTACGISNVKVAQYNSKKPIPIEVANIVSMDERSCSVIYNTNSLWIIEQHCSSSGDRQGIYIIDSSGVNKFGWFDRPFNGWAWSEGCNTKDDCYYIATVDGHGKITGFTYKFYINLSEGYYKVIIKDSNLVVTKKSITDHPS